MIELLVLLTLAGLWVGAAWLYQLRTPWFMTWYHNFRLNQWAVATVMVTLVIGVSATLTDLPLLSFSISATDNPSEWIVSVILLGTMIVTAITAIANRKQTEQATRPIVGVSIKQDSLRPWHIYFRIHNLSNADAEALVSVRLYLGKTGAPLAESQLLDSAYCGRMLWNLSARNRLQGHQDLTPTIAPAILNPGDRIEIEISVAFMRWDVGSQGRKFHRIYFVPVKRWEYEHSLSKQYQQLIPIVAFKESQAPHDFDHSIFDDQPNSRNII